MWLAFHVGTSIPICSIGDLDAHNNLGLTCTPEIRKGKLDPENDRCVLHFFCNDRSTLCVVRWYVSYLMRRFIVIASDGVWDYMTEDDVASVVMQVCPLFMDT